ncbi:MAG: hypothetical protein RL180_1663 [Pseudomonadota bacterium]|jgi:diguanylate cyclase (GGDEF)-like protein
MHQASLPTSPQSLAYVNHRHFIVLRFPAELERYYTAAHAKRAALDFRYRAIVILLLYIILSTGVVTLLPADRVMPWLQIYGGVGVIIVLAGVLAYMRQFDRWFSVYVGLGSLLAVGLSVATATVIHGGQSSILSHAGIMYAVIIIYSFVGLRFYHAMMAGWLGGGVGLTLTLLMKGELDWQLLHRTYTGTSLLGMALAYVIDYRSRHTYVQALRLQELYRKTTEQNKRLEALTREDGLTGLANRRHLDQTLFVEWERAMRQQEPLALLMIDVDHFKAYNDHLGHPAGDVCLREIAIAILQMARRSGDVAARYGGEEFALVFPATPASQALGFARQLVERVHALRLAHPASSVGRAVSVSVGVAVLVPMRGQVLQALITHADEALYYAKSSGRNRAVLYGHDPMPSTTATAPIDQSAVVVVTDDAPLS